MPDPEHHRLWEAAKEMPWVTYDETEGHPCNGGLELAAIGRGCKRVAFWHFTKDSQSSAMEGWMCWDHLLVRCLYADGIEQARVDVWMIEHGYREGDADA